MSASDANVEFRRLPVRTTPIADIRSQAQSVLDDLDSGDSAATHALLVERVLGPGAHDAGDLRMLADVTLDLGAASAAKEIYLRLLASSPNDVHALYGLAEAFRRIGRSDDALWTIEEAFGIDPHMRWTEGANFSLPDILGRLIATRPGMLTRKCVARLGRLGGILAAVGDTESLRAAIALANLRRRELLEAEDASNRLHGMFTLLGFAKSAPHDWNGRIYDELALPWMKQALQADQYSLGLDLEALIYRQFVLQTETEAHFHRCFADWTDDMRRAGHRAGAAMKALPAPAAPIPRIGFFIPSRALLAHTELLCTYLRALKAASPAPLEPRAYIFDVRTDDAPLAAALREIGVPITWLSDQAGASKVDRYDMLCTLREQSARDGLTALVWVSLAVHMPFAFAMRVAPVQIWWAMKYHSLDFPEIGGRVTVAGNPGTTDKNGRQWRVGGMIGDNWYVPGLTDAAKQLRATYSRFDILLGTIGREEKLVAKDYLRAVCRILAAHPGAAFLWTGRARHPEIQAAFEKSGVASRCFFLGWVDTRLYAQVLDVFLDSFPFGCGVTLIQAMAAGKPVVFFRSYENLTLGPLGTITALLSGGSGNRRDQARAREIFHSKDSGDLLVAVDTVDDYVGAATALMSDPKRRHAVGDALRRFVAAFYEDPKAIADTYTGHFIQIISEALGTDRAQQ